MEHSNLLGIHHVSAICGNPQENVDFYTQTLGLRLVKITVNYDDPTAYHLYYGDKIGSPGTVLTFFHSPSNSRGSRGAGMFTWFTFGVPPGSLEFWKDRLSFRSPEWYVNALGERTLMVNDHDGLHFRLVETENLNPHAWTETVPEEYAIQRINGVTLGARSEISRKFAELKLTIETLNECLMESGQTKVRLGVGSDHFDIVPNSIRSLNGKGTIHHVAFRLKNDKDQADWIERFKAQNINCSEVKDRNYFHSVYFREPGGALLELATDTPGFTSDESVENLGSKLLLPKFLMSQRDLIVSTLPPLQLPEITLA